MSRTLYFSPGQKTPQRDAVGVISKVMGKEVKVTQVDHSEGLAMLVKSTGIPEFLSQQLLKGQKLFDEVEGATVFYHPRYSAASSNIEKYLASHLLDF